MLYALLKVLFKELMLSDILKLLFEKLTLHTYRSYIKKKLTFISIQITFQTYIAPFWFWRLGESNR
jgi:hypothetical protein